MNNKTQTHENFPKKKMIDVSSFSFEKQISRSINTN